MKVLVIGSGGREHALVWKISQSPAVKKIYCAPGNAGIAKQAECLPISAEDVKSLAAWAEKERVDLTVVGPEAPLTMGIVDTFEARGLRIFGPHQKAAEIEGSKAFAKDLMKKYGIPAGESRVFEERGAAVRYVKEKGAPLVIKADGLAAGKGVIICRTLEEAVAAVDLILVEKAFGAAGAKVLVEEFLEGEEASFLAFTDGETVLPLPTSQDHKPVYDHDQGPNTGGMGAYSPAPVVTEKIHQEAMEKVMIPAVRGMAKEGRPYRGVLYAGLIIRDEKVKVLEFNARLGDPEAQPLLTRLKSDLIPVLQATIDGKLSNLKVEWDPRSTVCVVMASGGYPGSYEKGKVISGLEEAAKVAGTFVFHAGTALKEGKVVTNGGRVLGVTALGDGIRGAIEKAYEAAGKISWEGAYYRKDIGQKALKREGKKR
ncbi:MAG TPA: phosphoribosylamine--glycine ligase [Thermodesulfobacteriota bacterium]|nr:phosphoribosylamine--glycine ligase [Thermodesulfobacteriota bacterium]